MENSGERFLTIYQAYVDEIYAYLLSRSGLEPQTAEDLTQETFVAVFQGLNRFRGLCSVRTWVYRIAKNKLTDFYRGRYKKAMESMSLDDERAADFSAGQADMDCLLLNLHESRRVADSMRALPEHYRLTLVLKYVEELSVREIARLAQKNEKSVENTLRRAKAAFARRYLALDEEDRGYEAD
ncbi:MAG: RNA polymerase sigma factor [Eubacteriales bacterium]|nr:RNA polymerase sigma factor [Eubacteriales bacterium]